MNCSHSYKLIHLSYVIRYYVNISEIAWLLIRFYSLSYLCKTLSVLVFPLRISSWAREELPVKKSQIEEHVLRDANWKLKPNPKQTKTPDTYFSSETSSKPLVKCQWFLLDSLLYASTYITDLLYGKEWHIFLGTANKTFIIVIEENRHKHQCLFTILAPSSLWALAGGSQLSLWHKSE